MNSYYDPTKPHHRPDGFVNNYSEEVVKSLAEVMRWRFNAARTGVPKPPRTPIPSTQPDLARLQAYAGDSVAQPSVTWVGHATALVQLGGLSLLTDPIFSERASPLRRVGPKRHQPPGLALDQLPHIDLVLVSHNHYDHLDEASVRALNSQAGGPPLFIVPLGLKPWLAARGITHAVELDWWDSHQVAPRGSVNASSGANGLNGSNVTTNANGSNGKASNGAGCEVVLVPAQHWSARGLNDRMLTLWGGFAVFSHDLHLFYAGDTGYSRDFADVRQRFAARQNGRRGGGFDLALLPIGAYEPRWFMSAQHVNVEEALQIHIDLGAKRSLGVHWGTFELTDESLDTPPAELQRQRVLRGVREEDFFVMAIGETRVLPRRQNGVAD